ncbi:MAG: hypothetical protein PWR28_67 [Synergistaceae bacterium]|nr:hypothetical protein [Synergistaceae bacterium]
MIYDVIVLGGGPVGCFAARLLAEKGLSTLVVEEHEKIGLPARCTGLIGDEAFRRFLLPEEAVERSVTSLCAFGPLGTSVQYAADCVLARVVNRPHFDALLADSARRCGAQIMTGSKVSAVSASSNDCAIAIEGGKIFRSRSAIIASGGRSNLTAKLGLGRLKHFIWGAQAEVAFADAEEVEVYVGRTISPGSFAWVVPASPGRARVGLLSYDHPRERFFSLLNDHRIKPRLRETPTPVIAPIPMGSLSRTVSNGVVVVGEAAGQVKTTTGGGVYFGLLCANIAVDVLTQALEEDDLGSERLSVYDERWRALLSKEIEAGLRLRRFARYLSDEAVASLMNFAFNDEIMGRSAPFFSFDWHAQIISRLAKEMPRRLLARGIKALSAS